ncbi:MAG: hypothetical protein FWD91_06425, partial [Treponema sp.]|nr:hypothetical protein [Treponema sp.]
QLAQAAFNSAAAIFAGLVEIRNSTQRNGRTVDNARNVLFMFLAASSFRLPGEAVTVSQKTTRTATENLYRTMAFSVSAKIIADMDFLTRETACGCWRLLEKLEDSIDKENPAVHSALRDTLSALSRRLSSQKTSTQKRRHFPSAVPVLYIAHYLGCTEENLRRMNRIGDSFLVQGDVLYV